MILFLEHLRVNRMKNGTGYYTQVKISGKNKKIEEVGPIEILINKWAKPLGIIFISVFFLLFHYFLLINVNSFESSVPWKCVLPTL